jgi:hypothetical protein
VIAELQTVPTSEEEWAIWAWHHRDNHEQIISAIQAKKGVGLKEYQVEPIPWNHIELFAENNQQMHFDMNIALNIQQSDLGEFDPKNSEKLAQWIYSHWLEHQQVAVALGI